MARAHFVKKARKDNPAVLKGESYYWWKFRYGPKHYSKTRPTASQLTNSPFLSTLYALQDAIAVLEDPEELESILDEISELRDECEGSLDNMPDHLRDTSDSGVILQERIDALDGWHQELEIIDIEEENALEQIKSCECNL